MNAEGRLRHKTLRAHRHSAGTEGAHVKPDGGGTRPAVIRERQRPRGRIRTVQRVRREEHQRLSRALAVLDRQATGRRRIAQRLPVRRHLMMRDARGRFFHVEAEVCVCCSAAGGGSALGCFRSRPFGFTRGRLLLGLELSRARGWLGLGARWRRRLRRWRRLRSAPLLRERGNRECGNENERENGFLLKHGAGFYSRHSAGGDPHRSDDLRAGAARDFRDPRAGDPPRRGSHGAAAGPSRDSVSLPRVG